jgi:hypothetical protein
MTDLRRLGKRGSYRLGRLAMPVPQRSAPGPRYPSFAPRHRGPATVWVAACLGGAALVWAGALAGWWFMPFLAGLAAGAAAHFGHWRLRVSLPAAVIIAAAGWGAALWWLDLHSHPEGAVARVIASLAGLPPHAATAIAGTLLVAVLQAAAGLWLGRALVPGRAR